MTSFSSTINEYLANTLFDCQSSLSSPAFDRDSDSFDLFSCLVNLLSILFTISNLGEAVLISAQYRFLMPTYCFRICALSFLFIVSGFCCVPHVNQVSSLYHNLILHCLISI